MGFGLYNYEIEGNEGGYVGIKIVMIAVTLQST